MPALAGCGSDDALSPEAVAEAADKTASKGSVRVAIKQTITLQGGSPIQTSGEGVVDPKSRRGRLKSDLSGIPGRPNDIGSGSQEIIFDGFTMYMRSPLFAGALPAGKTWLKIDVNKAGKAAGIDLGALAQQGQDPTEALRYLKAASGDVERVGEEDVRGTKTTRYKATIDFKRYPDLVPAKDRAAVRRSIEQIIKLSGAEKAPMEVWIGEDGVVRRLRQRINTVIATGMRSTADQQIELYDFGVSVAVQPPPAGDTQDATDLATEGMRRLTE